MTSAVTSDLLGKLFGLTGRRALITGSSRGIGYLIAQHLAGAGARVVLNARQSAALSDAATRLRGSGHAVEVAAFDATDRDAVNTQVAALLAAGPIDILVNNAGLQRRHLFVDFPQRDWDDVLRTNLSAAFFVSQAVARHMMSRRRGKIINVLSIQAELARPGISAYAASKGALQMLTRSLCVELAPHDIQVNGLAPGYFATDMTEALVKDEKFSAWLSARTPAARWGRLAELGGAAIFLASDASSFVNGHTLFVDGGMHASV